MEETTETLCVGIDLGTSRSSISASNGERRIMKEGSEKDYEAVQELVRHLISLAGIKQKGKGKPKVRAVIGVPAEAFRVSRQNLRSTIDGIADSVMMVSEPFAV